MAGYIGNQPVQAYSAGTQKDIFVPNGTIRRFAFQFNKPQLQASDVILVVNNVIQNPGSTYDLIDLYEVLLTGLTGGTFVVGSTVTSGANSGVVVVSEGSRIFVEMTTGLFAPGNVLTSGAVSGTVESSTFQDNRGLKFASAPLVTDEIYAITSGLPTIFALPPDGSITAEKLSADLKRIDVDKFAATAGQTQIILSRTPATADSVLVFVNGVFQTSGLNYTISGTNLTFTGGLQLDDKVQVVYQVFAGSSQTNADFVAIDDGVGGANYQNVQEYNEYLKSGSGASELGYTPSGTGAVTTTVEDKLLESVSLFDFLTKAQIADVQANTLAIDLTTHIQAALNSGAKRIKAPAGSYLHQKLIIPEGVQLYGEGIRFTKFICFNIIGDVHIELGVKGKLSDIYFSPQSKPLLYDNLPSVTHPMVREGAFNYNDNIDAVLMGSGSKVVDCEFDGFRYGIYGNQGKSNLTVIDTISRAGRWGMYFYIVDGVKVRGGKSVGGNEGGLALVSSRRCSVSGVTVINPNGTGINTGGSSGGDVPGGASFDTFNASEITITNNIVYARDCINSENGVDGYTVTNNVCRVVSALTTNGVGISAQNRDATGGRIRNVTISANDVNSYDYSREYSTGILVGAAGVNSPNVPVDQVSVTGNVVQNSNQAYRFESINANFVQGLTVSGNVGKPSRTGIYLDRVKRACVSGNSISRNTGTTAASTFGVIVSKVDRSTLVGNCIKGMAEHISQSGVCTETYVYDLISEPNDDLGGYQVFVNTSGGAPVGFALSAASPKAYIAFDGNTGNPVNRLFASVVKNAVGDYTINWAIPFPNANYIVQVTAGETSGVGGPFGVRQIVSKTTTSFRFLLSAPNGTLVDAGSVMVLALGS